jgi:tripartite-type tricarboxylate transporter receptor subunit TctC
VGKIALCFLMALGIALASSARVSAQSAAYYEGKTLRIVVGSAPGGGLDTYSRVIARHMGRHIKGDPTIIVENMPGAGSLIAANHLYKAAKPDGITIGNFIGIGLMGQILGRPGIEFDARRFEYIGVPAKFGSVCAFTKASGITSMEQWMTSKKPVKLGSTGPGGNIYEGAMILKTALNLPMQLISGYKSIGEIRLAAEGGEIDGICGVGWQSLKPTWKAALDAGEVTVILQMVPQPHSDLPLTPLAMNFAKTEEARQLIKIGIYDAGSYVFVYALPPATPKDRVEVLRRAFLDTLRDPEFMPDAKKSNLEINPVAGAEVHDLIMGLFKLDPGIVSTLREVLK